MSEGQKLISQFHKTSIELVKINLSEWKSKLYVDVRVWVLEEPTKPGSAVPTKKGIRLSVDLLPKLVEALNKASRIHKKQREETEILNRHQ
jgi:hypothetical protein